MPANGSVLIKKKSDLVLILVFCMAALIALLAVRAVRREGSYAQVRIDGEIYGNYSLSENQTIDLRGEDFVSRLEILDGAADMTLADCPDQICVHHPPVRYRGETIVCLPHRLVVEVISDEEESSEEMDAVSR